MLPTQRRTRRPTRLLLCSRRLRLFHSLRVIIGDCRRLFQVPGRQRSTPSMASELVDVNRTTGTGYSSNEEQQLRILSLARRDTSPLWHASLTFARNGTTQQSKLQPNIPPRNRQLRMLNLVQRDTCTFWHRTLTWDRDGRTQQSKSKPKIVVHRGTDSSVVEPFSR
ncbi:hypothetical protein VUR80DRAFT_8684 [Thermomyces stellatus]